jgi:hypothetical protein
VPIFVEEYSVCQGRLTAPPPVSVPASGTVFDLLTAMADTYNDMGLGADRFAVVPRAAGYLVAPTDRPLLVDVVVTVDPARCPTVTLAEQSCAYSDVMANTKTWIGWNPFVDPRDVLKNEVTITAPLLEALQAVHSPHSRTPVGFSVEVEPRAGEERGWAALLLMADVAPIEDTTMPDFDVPPLLDRPEAVEAP